ncbi:DUF998 domain-containing protein [Catenuloplanes atrovinosus]|uniref:DUF998 domain-containing protein n=1 Tax=Catenuloplanes atrovinosus TaxID=137266 RepID=A0AAE3YYI3_9ACTN|nr:DUF998 domain-containing protein [Catenuloplanes atrovinosus]MDR7281057.1 hypothetical protein [Catenuloplanes atrovinosus]
MTGDWFRYALLCLALSTTAGSGLLLHGGVDQVNELVSDAVRSRSGAVLLALAACGLAGAGVWLCAGARRGLPRTRRLVALLAVWVVSLIAVAFFPTNLPGTPLTAAGVVHRYAAAAAVGLPPLVALLVAEKSGQRARLLRTVGFATLAACAAFAAVHGPEVLLGSSRPPYAGLAERLLLALVLLATGLSAWVIKRAEQTR